MHQYIHNNLEMSSLIIHFAAGPHFENYGTRGTSHLMEHLVCKTLEPYQDELQMKYIKLDAFTDDDGVVIAFSGLSSVLDPLQRRLVEALTGGIDCVTEEMFEAEKKTVIAEDGAVFENPAAAIELYGLHKFYNYYSSIGCICDVEKFTYEDMKRVYQERFTRPIKIISIGPVGINFPGVQYINPDEIHEHTLTYNPSGYKCDAPDDIDCISYTPFMHITAPIAKEDYSKMMLGMSMLGDGLNSPIEQEVRVKRGLCYDFHDDVILSKDKAVVCFGGYAPTANINQIEKIYEEIVCNVGRFLTEDRFNICKTMLQVMRKKHEVLKFANVCELLSEGRLDEYEGLDEMTFGQVFDTVKKYINPESVISICPQEEHRNDGNDDVYWPVHCKHYN